MELSDGPSEEWRAGFNYAMDVMALWLDFQQDQALDGHPSLPGATSVGMRKSNLLGRLVRGEGIRLRPCPKHGGRMAPGYPLCDPGEILCCDGTGWLRNEESRPRKWWQFWRPSRDG